MDRETVKAINDLSKKINEMSEKIDAYFNSKHEDNKATIDYIAMMTDTELPDGTTEEDGINAQ